MKCTCRILLLSIIAFVIFIACKKQKPDRAETPVPNTGINTNLAVVSTSSVTLVGETNALSGGTITSSSTGRPILESGVCWAKHHNPEITDPRNLDTSPGLGTFTCALSNLDPSTIYYVRAYATNSYSTAYGNAISFKSQPIWWNVSYSNNVGSMAALGGTVFYAPSLSKGLFYSVDEGDNWNTANNEIANTQISCITSDSKYVFAGSQDKGVFRSVNGGINWTTVNNGLGSLFIKKIAASSSLVVAASSNSVFVSYDHGLVWNFSKSSTSAITSLSIKDGTVYVSTENDGLFLSTDSGDNWLNVTGTLSPNLMITLVGISGENVLINTGEGIYVSSRKNHTWNKLLLSATPGFVSFVTVNNRLYASGHYGKVFYSDNHGLSFTEIKNGLSPSSFNFGYQLTATDKNVFAGAEDIYKRLLN